MLAKTKAGAMVAELVRQVAKWGIEQDKVGALTGADILALHEHIVRKGFAIAIHSVGPGELALTCVLNQVGRKDARQRLGHCYQVLRQMNWPLNTPRPSRLRGRDLYLLAHAEEPLEKKNGDQAGAVRGPKPADQKATRSPAPFGAAWFEGDDLILISYEFDKSDDATLARLHKEFLARVLDAIDGKLPSAAAHPGYRAALAEGKDLKGFEPAGLFFIGPDSDRGLVPALAAIFDVPIKTAPLASKSARNATPAQKTLDNDLRRAALEVSELPPVFTERDLDLMKLDRAGEEANENRPAPPEPGELPHDVFAQARERTDPDGIESIRQVAIRFGFQGRAFLTDVRIEAPAPRYGLVALIDQPTFRTDQLPPIPAGTTNFAAGSLDLKTTYQRFVGLWKVVEPASADEVLALERFVKDQPNLSLTDDFLKHLGPRWCVYESECKKRERGESASLCRRTLCSWPASTTPTRLPRSSIGSGPEPIGPLLTCFPGSRERRWRPCFRASSWRNWPRQSADTELIPKSISVLSSVRMGNR